MNTTRTMMDKFGVFPHSNTNPEGYVNGYYLDRFAVAWYRSESAAEKYAKKNSHLNLVVRPLNYIKFV